MFLVSVTCTDSLHVPCEPAISIMGGERASTTVINTRQGRECKQVVMLRSLIKGMAILMGPVSDSWIRADPKMVRMELEAWTEGGYVIINASLTYRMEASRRHGQSRRCMEASYISA